MLLTDIFCSLCHIPFSLFRLPNLFTTFMFVPRLCRPRAHREDASAEPPPRMKNSSQIGYTFFSALALLMLPQSVWAAGAVATTTAAAAPTALSVSLLIFFCLARYWRLFCLFACRICSA